MDRYAITAPDGHVGYMDLNRAAIAMYEAKPGWTVERVGPSRVTVVDEPKPAVGDTVKPRPGLTRGGTGTPFADVSYVVVEVHDFRDDADPALYLTILEESVYRQIVGRDPLPAWSPWHAVVGAEDVVRVAQDGLAA